MLRNIPLKKLAMELRYKPDLGFYNKMDAIGLELTEDYADWERSPLTLEVRNKKKHRRLFLSVKRSFVDIDDADPDGDFSHAVKLLGRICPKLCVKEFNRIGVRQWFAADLNKPFALMVDQFAERFLPKNQDLTAILNDKTKDVAYVVECMTDDGWKYNLRMGPMLKKQWFLLVAHERDAFEQGDEATETFEKFRQSIPEQFLYVDIDCFAEERSVDRLDSFLASVRRRSQELASKLIEYCRK
jgi:hypothetical protein